MFFELLKAVSERYTGSNEAYVFGTLQRSQNNLGFAVTKITVPLSRQARYKPAVA